VQTFGAGTKNPLIVVDDIPLGVNDSSTGGLTLSTWHIDPNNVEKITVLRGLAATNKYGTLARGGAILIYTKTRAGADVRNKEQSNSAMVKGNTYNETVTTVKTTPKGDYLKELKKTKSVEEAYSLYLSQRESYRDDFQYFVDASKSMLKWGDPDLSKRILLNILEMNPNDVEFLRYAGMLLQDRKNFSLAREVYEHVLLLKPGESQSYRDLALMLTESHQYQKSLDMYRKMKDGSYPSVNFEGLRKPLNSEMKRLILMHRSQLDTQGLSSHYQTPMNYDVRVVVDYNDRDAEFDLQFVNPQKKFFVWSHRKFENGTRIEQEKREGFNTEEFFLIDAEPGKWQVNIESPKQDSRRPLALRYTVYRNYGTKEETRQSKTLVLNTIEGKFLLGIIKI
jgi:tetratricopeptide (TPR) repeat protein